MRRNDRASINANTAGVNVAEIISEELCWNHARWLARFSFRIFSRFLKRHRPWSHVRAAYNVSYRYFLNIWLFFLPFTRVHVSNVSACTFENCRSESDIVQCTQHVAISFLDVTFEYLSSVMFIEHLHRNARWDLWQMVKIHAPRRFASDIFYNDWKGNNLTAVAFEPLTYVAPNI